MCAQCMATAATVVGATAGMRAGLGPWIRARLGARALAAVTATLVLAGVLAAGLI